MEPQRPALTMTVSKLSDKVVESLKAVLASTNADVKQHKEMRVALLRVVDTWNDLTQRNASKKASYTSETRAVVDPDFDDVKGMRFLTVQALITILEDAPWSEDTSETRDMEDEPTNRTIQQIYHGIKLVLAHVNGYLVEAGIAKEDYSSDNEVAEEEKATGDSNATQHKSGFKADGSAAGTLLSQIEDADDESNASSAENSQSAMPLGPKKRSKKSKSTTSRPKQSKAAGEAQSSMSISPAKKTSPKSPAGSQDSAEQSPKRRGNFSARPEKTNSWTTPEELEVLKIWRDNSTSTGAQKVVVLNNRMARYRRERGLEKCDGRTESAVKQHMSGLKAKGITIARLEAILKKEESSTGAN